MPPVAAQPGAAVPQLLAAISSCQTFIAHLPETADCFPLRVKSCGLLTVTAGGLSTAQFLRSNECAASCAFA